MTEERGTTDPTAGSGSAVGKTYGKKPFGNPISGKTPELGDLIYKFNTKDQADMYLRTTTAIADYVGVEYGRDMRMLVKKGKEKVFTEPQPPRKSKDETALAPGTLEKYRTELTIYYNDKKEYEERYAKVFLVIIGQCSPSVRS